MQTLRSGRILLPFAHGGNHKKNLDVAIRFVCLRSDDNGHTWQGWDDQNIGMHQVHPYGKVIELHDGELLCPGWGMTNEMNTAPSGSRLVRSRDGGVTWGDWNFISDRKGDNETDLTLSPMGESWR